MFDAENFLTDYNINVSSEGKNTQEGWKNIRCCMPGCTDNSNHGGFNLGTGSYNCWRCGHHDMDDVLVNLLRITKQDAWKIIKDYQTDSPGLKIKVKKKKIIRAKIISLPEGTKELNEKQKKYLIKRKFNPDKLIKIWKIQGTQHYGDYCFRIIAPIYLDNILVSYQGRDITGKSTLRYKACKIEDEVVHHKHILYGADYIINKKAVLVEGITDVWRLGPGAVATFGTSFTQEQLLFIAKRIDELFILFDPEDKEVKQKTEKLAYRLVGIVKNVYRIEIKHKGDPGDLAQSRANKIIKELLK